MPIPPHENLIVGACAIACVLLVATGLFDAESAQAIFKEFDVLDYGVWFWVICTVLAILSTVVIVVTA